MIRRVWGLLCAKSYVVAKRPPFGVEAWRRRLELRRRPRHLAAVQNYEVRPLITPVLLQNGTGRGGLVVRCRLRGWRAPGSKPDLTEDPACMWACCIRGQTSHIWCGAEVWRGVPSQLSSSSTDRGSKLRVTPSPHYRGFSVESDP
ncbi:hypothetical protein AVEN_265596-1 [Araneus ventricosus]|uniref:Uncharacterized protein n=1 Tax=Araneus ventricosus TaxID=182803 RepID=A0A4Y2PE77_ARAVE|nr:hypothetical protein AVEN_265596-1 [Araneus ventricosus]